MANPYEYSTNIFIHDFTGELLEIMRQRYGNNFVIFNPSICRVPERHDMYILSFRYILGSGADIGPVITTDDPRHPWQSNWCSQADGTGFVYLNTNPNTFPGVVGIHRDVVVMPGDEVTNIDNYENGLLKGFNDLRLFTYNNVVLMTFNAWTSQYSDRPTGLFRGKTKMYERKDRQPNTACNKDPKAIYDYCTTKFCGQMGAAIGMINGNKLLLTDSLFICPSCTQSPVEKNWTAYTISNQLYIAYSIQGAYRYLKPIAELVDCEMYETVRGVPQFLQQLHESHHLIFSLSTPAVEWDATRLLAVGHAKIEHKKIDSIRIDDLLARQLKGWDAFIAATSATRTHQKHKGYYYFMFFYLINKTSHEIEGVSKLFIPYENEPYSVFFPSGLTTIGEDGTFALSYGVGDIASKVLFFTKGLLNLLELQDNRMSIAAVRANGTTIPSPKVIGNTISYGSISYNSPICYRGQHMDSNAPSTFGGGKKKKNTQTSKKKNKQLPK